MCDQIQLYKYSSGQHHKCRKRKEKALEFGVFTEILFIVCNVNNKPVTMERKYILLMEQQRICWGDILMPAYTLLKSFSRSTSYITGLKNGCLKSHDLTVFFDTSSWRQAWWKCSVLIWVVVEVGMGASSCQLAAVGLASQLFKAVIVKWISQRRPQHWNRQRIRTKSELKAICYCWKDMGKVNMSILCHHRDSHCIVGLLTESSVHAMATSVSFHCLNFEGTT